MSRLLILHEGPLSSHMIDLDEVVRVEQVWYPGHNHLKVFLRSFPNDPLRFNEGWGMQEAWALISQHALNAPPAPKPSSL